MTALPILILAVLAVLGAGLVPGVAPPMAVALLAAACMRPLPRQHSFRLTVWLLMALVAWVAFSLAAVPTWAGAWRTAAWEDIRVFAARHGSLCGLSPLAPGTPRLTLHAGGTLRWLVLVLGAGGMFCLTASLRTRQRVALLKALVVLGGLVAAAGLVGRLLIPAGESLMWWYPVAEIGGGTPFGPFVNRNHFAAFCALLAPLAVALTCHASGSAVAGWSVDPHAAHPEPSLDVSLGERLLYGTCLIVLMAGILCSQSRGGTAAALLGLIVVALLWIRRSPAAAAFATLAGVGGLLLVVLWPNAEFQGRLHGMRDVADAMGARWPVWLDSVRLWSQVPWAGCGANAFVMVFPRVTTWATGQQASHAESDYLQLLAEGGVIGVLLAAAVLSACSLPLLRALYRGCRRPRHHGDPGDGDDAAGASLGILPPAAEPGPVPRSAVSPRHQSVLPYSILAGVGGALVALGLHSVVDVPLRVPLCAWTAAAIAGLVAPPAPRRRRGSERRAWPGLEGAALAALLAAVLVMGWVRPGWRALYRDRDAWLADATTADIAALLAGTPTYWQAWYEMGDRFCAQAARASGPRQMALLEAGWDALRSAVRCSPRDPRLRAVLAARLWAAGQWTEARSHRDTQLALLPGDRSVRMHWLQVEWQAGQMVECRQLAYRFAAGAPADPAAPEYLLWLARRELAEGSVTQARAALQTVLARRANDADAHRALAQCANRLGDPEEEARCLSQLAATGHADAPAWWRLAELARARRDRQALQEALGKAIQLEPSRRRAADELWKAFVQKGAGGAP